MRSTRGRAGRDASTAETVRAAVSGALLATAAFLAAAGPALGGGVHGQAAKGCVVAAVVLAAAAFCGRVAVTLHRIERRRAADADSHAPARPGGDEPGTGASATAARGVDQPSQPGRTSPDS